MDAGRDWLRTGLIAFGAYQVALGLLQVVAPGTFFEEIGPFGARNDHYIRDDATWELALGFALVVAARLPSWRVPVLVFAIVHFALHTVNHVVDAGEAEPGWVGVADALALALGTGLLWALLAASRRREAAGRGRAG